MWGMGSGWGQPSSPGPGWRHRWIRRIWWPRPWRPWWHRW